MPKLTASASCTSPGAATSPMPVCVGRTYKEFTEHCRFAGIEECTEINTIIGRVGGKILFTVLLPGGLLLAFLRRRRCLWSIGQSFSERGL